MMNEKTDSESMERVSCLIFSLNQLDFAIEAASVREIVWLPKLTPIEEVPHYVVGVLNLRGFVVPVIDLNLRFGHASQPYRLDNKVIVLESGNHLVGMIVDEVTDVLEINRSDIADIPLAEQQNSEHSHYIAGEVKLDESIAMLLSARVICELELDESSDDQPDADRGDTHTSECRRFCPDASEEDHDIFQQRAKALMQSLQEDESAHKMLAVVAISSELFGVELDLIREFSDIGHVVPIPCVPRHIVGDMNLRGEILTIVDIKSLIGVPEKSGIRAAKLIVTARGDQIIGIPIDGVRDLIRMDSSSNHCAGDEHYLKRTIAYDQQVLGVLDLEQIMAADALVVDQTV